MLHILKENFRIDASDARSKSWDEFKDVMFDFVIAICDDAKENCPIWSGQPVVAHWSYPDPSDFEGTEEEKLRQIAQVTAQIRRRLDLFCALPLEKMEKNNLEYAVTSMGKGTLNGKRE